ncbi:MAG: anhydro-N-acetylmuramic acid kinase [Gemmatimonadota bacterium]
MSIFVGVMSGTSLDGLDVAVIDVAGGDERPAHVDVLAFRSTPYEPAFRERIRGVIECGTTADVCDFDFVMGRVIGEAVQDTLAVAGLAAGDVEAIGSHGQTIWHVPPDPGRPGSTLQVGNAAVIAEIAGADVIADFRARDVAAGGHGAPLTAYVDHLLFSADQPRLIQNIGGMANVTALPPAGSTEVPLAFDTGPGVALIDGAVRSLTGRPYDEGGELAAAGNVAAVAMGEWLDDPFFDETPPRSTGRERFSTGRLESWLEVHDLSAEDAAATLTELTARSIAESYRFVGHALAACYVCGGGARNPALVARLAALVAPRPLHDLSALGVDAGAREAIAFALLARQHVLGFPANAPWATGASGRRLLGHRTSA